MLVINTAIPYRKQEKYQSDFFIFAACFLQQLTYIKKHLTAFQKAPGIYRL